MGYLWFFVGVLTGIAIDSPLKYIARSLRERQRVTPDPTVFVWQLFLIVLLIEFWVASISISTAEMGLAQFLLFLLLPFGAMILSSLTNPTVEPTVDQLEEFESQRLAFFGILALLPVISLLREVVAGETIPLDADLIYRVLVFIGAILGLFIRSRRAGLPHAIAMLILIDHGEDGGVEVGRHLCRVDQQRRPGVGCGLVTPRRTSLAGPPTEGGSAADRDSGVRRDTVGSRDPVSLWPGGLGSSEPSLSEPLAFDSGPQWSATLVLV